MRRGSRAWWLYNGVYVAVVAAEMAVLFALPLWLWPPVNGSNPDWLYPAIVAAVVLWRVAPECAAKAICRASGLSHEAHVSCWLESVEQSEPPAADPPRIGCERQTPRYWPLVAWSCRILGFLYVAVAVVGVLQRDWASLGCGAVGALLFLGVLALAERQPCTMEVDAEGLRNPRCSLAVAWNSIYRGWVSQDYDVQGKLRCEWLCLQDADGKRLWLSNIETLPPEVRADLFAWLRARANLREPAAQ